MGCWYRDAGLWWLRVAERHTSKERMAGNTLLLRAFITFWIVLRWSTQTQLLDLLSMITPFAGSDSLRIQSLRPLTMESIGRFIHWQAGPGT